MEMWNVWLTSIISFFVVILANWVYRWRNPKYCNGKLPPGSMGLPLIGETFNFLVTGNSIDIHPFVKKRMERYGPLFKTSILGRRVAVSLNPDFNYYVLQQEDKFVEIDFMDSFTKLLNLENYMGNIGGCLHKYFRRTILNHLGLEALKQNLMTQFEDVINHELQEWTKQPEVDVRSKTAAMLFDLVSNIFMSCRLEENFGEDLSKILQALMTFPLYIPGTTFYRSMQKQKKAFKLINKLVEERIKKKSNDPKGCNDKGDLLDQLVGDIGKEPFSTKEFVFCFVYGMIIVTLVNIAPAMTLLTKNLLDNPSALQQLMEEHEEILKSREDVNSRLSWKEYKSLTFTHYVINESLRLTMSFPGVSRRVIADIHVDGYIIPKGWMLLVIPIVHLNPDVYKDPLSFNPLRWKNIGGNAMVKNFAPFGGGDRACVGAEFSKAFMAVYLHVWVTKYRFTKLKGGDVVRAPLLEFANPFYINISEKH